MNNGFMTAADVAEFLGVSQSFAYKVVQTLNKEMKAKGFHTIAGKVNTEYFKEKYCYQRKE
ncbi:DNA-binding protein [Bengtsoniella intestinalis]|uniref:DNA-binding protein n=1 Tax=Bengtsoniella intestinalis TaxID=3073143 RepID=UPI00391F9A64